MESIVIGGERCREWAESSELEWLETNGTGGFAMGTVSGANTRRYHGLLVASLRPPVERQVLLSRLEEEVLCDGEMSNLGAAQYPGAVTPAGFQMLEEFRLDPFPTWVYRTGCARVEKRVFLVEGSQTVVVLYRVSSRCRLRVRPFLAYRDYHCLQHASDAFRRDVESAGSTLRVEPFAGGPRLRLHHNAAGFVRVGNWYYRNEYRKEMERGLDFQEDLYSPGWLDFELEAGGTAFVVGTLEEFTAPSLDDVFAWERARCAAAEDVPGRLERAAEQFLVRRVDGSPTIIAGYPWFTDWGRDTMISIPGLLLARGRFAEARAILRGFLQYLDQGLIPNRFPDGGERPEYNTADATLWMFVAAWGLRGDSASCSEFLRSEFYPAAKEIVAWHRRGTHYGIQVDAADGLLSAGYAGTQLTWMDAKVGDWVVTPRHGKAVEINALWYNALRMTASWALEFGETEYAEELDGFADRVRESFGRAFWNAERGCLYDRIAPEGPDARVRPNQLFAVSLPFGLLDEEEQRAVVRVVEAELLTPVGLRTLAPGDGEYRGRYEGGPWQRDGAYHQGTVWPWLMGPYVDARLAALGCTAENVSLCMGLVSRMMGELERQCLGSVAEIYDGDEPRRAVGAPAQAWSVAELLRVRQKLVGVTSTASRPQ
ncbi:MAG: glycogen debranching enzyme family protein [Acidobacteria bacterium]|nr:glycogen debranching enzyme family protein [Acidobacteriota bacterium]